MDSLTQAVLGATVGGAVAGRTMGRRAILWGAVAGTVPDLDVLANPFLDASGALRFHRGLTHGLAFSLWAGPLLAWLARQFDCWRALRKPSAPTLAPWRDYAAVFALGLVTHPLLDVFTIYGTQLLAPFSDRPFAIGSTFIIDPAYTVPLAVGLAGAIWARPDRRRQWAVAGLAASTAVLGLHVVAQRHATETVEQAFAEQGMEPNRLLVAAGPFTSLLWRGVAQVGDQAFPFWLHVADAPGEVVIEAPVPLVRFPRDVAERRGAATLTWFSRGWLTYVDAARGEWAVADLRFGRAGLSSGAPYVFSWDLPDGARSLRQRSVSPDIDVDAFGEFWARILHRDGPRRRPGRISLPPPNPSP